MGDKIPGQMELVLRRKPRRRDGPGITERKHQRALGFGWCRGCRTWLPLAEIRREGACRPCLNAEWNAYNRAGRLKPKVYTRKTNGPGRTERRAKAKLGLRWCRGCEKWLPSAQVVTQGTCRTCTNAEYREKYAANPAAIRRRVYARKRGIDPMPAIAVELLTEQFGGLCAYCPDPATSWDHIVAVMRGGRTEPGNIVPACQPCNSSKKAQPVVDWLRATGRIPSPALWEVIALIPDTYALEEYAA